jgi:hypothetical protein
MTARRFAAILFCSALCACASHKASAPAPSALPLEDRRTITVTAPAQYTEHSYRGKPDVALTYAILKAGGGPNRFDSAKFFAVAGGSHAKAEARRLERIYGKARVAAFMQTFTFAMHDLNTLFRLNRIELSDQPRFSPHKGRDLAVAIYHAGIMPNGKYDCGYMMEHLMTHPVHIVLMHDINVASGHGPAHNANFHIILTRVVLDLKNMYGATSPRPRRLSQNPSPHYTRRSAAP